MGRLAFLDAVAKGTLPSELPAEAKAVLEAAMAEELAESRGKAEVEKAAMALSRDLFNDKTVPSLAFPKRLGNSFPR